VRSEKGETRRQPTILRIGMGRLSAQLNSMLSGRWFGCIVVEDIDTNASDQELLVAVLERQGLMKKAGRILAARPPNDTGARFLLAQYKKGDCPPWLAAYLLGCVRHELGYATVLQILLDAPGLCAESYAGVALA
jgi:hypothetical protein